MGVRVVIVTILLLAILGGSAYGVRELALRAADQVTVTITQTSPPGPTGVVFQKTFGRSVAAEMESLLNDNTSAPNTDPASAGTGPHPTWVYRFTFTLQDVVLESAWAQYQTEPELYTISALGVTGGQRIGWRLIPKLSAQSHGAVPLPPMETS